MSSFRFTHDANEALFILLTFGKQQR